MSIFNHLILKKNILGTIFALCRVLALARYVEGTVFNEGLITIDLKKWFLGSNRLF